MALRLWLAIILLTPVCIYGQTASADTAVLTTVDFINIVRTFHPVVKQTNIEIEKAKAGILMARGGFDPLAYVNSDQKTFDGKFYYRYTNPELKIPTWYGIELKAGLENNNGAFLNEETTSGKSSYVGIAVPLAKGLLMDSRRATLKQSKIFRQQSVSEQQNTINNLLNDAYASYWNWAKEYQVYKILTNAVVINEQRFALVKIGFRQGDRAAIDTIEALAQLQNFQYLQNESLVELKNANVALSAFLWLENNMFYQLKDDVIPNEEWLRLNVSIIPIEPLNDILSNARRTHPKLSIFLFKLQGLEVERRLKFQSLLPTLNVKANLLNRGYDVFKGINPGFYENNNKFGIDFGLPLRLSEGRGSYRIAKLKISETNLDLSLTQQEIENKIRFYYNEVFGLQRQIAIYEQAYRNYQTLLRGEEIRFREGESTLFLLNIRENKVLETLQKLTELRAKFYKAEVALQWAAGQLR